MSKNTLIFLLLSFSLISGAQAEGESKLKPLVGVSVDTVEVELTSLSEATSQLAGAMTSM